MQKLYLYKTIYILVGFFSTFFLPMNKEPKKIKNLKIDPKVHDVLKKYCDKRGIKMYRFLENLILEKCSEKKDLYGE
jgi:hypothetical protein